jgi:hypothetical protein
VAVRVSRLHDERSESAFDSEPAPEEVKNGRQECLPHEGAGHPVGQTFLSASTGTDSQFFNNRRNSTKPITAMRMSAPQTPSTGMKRPSLARLVPHSMSG